MNNYWEERYKHGGNSGSGSYDKDAEFKSMMINEYISKYNIKTICDFGCGDGNQISFLLGFELYHGYDISEFIIEKNIINFKNNNNMFFYKNIIDLPESDLCISLDVLYHILDDVDFEDYLTNLFKKSKKYVLIYSTNRNNTSDDNAPHCYHRIFTDWIDENCKNFRLIDDSKRLHSSVKFFLYERGEK